MRKIVIACRTGKGEFVRVHNDEVGKRLECVVRRLERGNRGGGAQCDIKGAAQDGRHETGRTQGDIIQDVHAVGFMDGGRGVSAKTGADTANVNAMTAVLISFISYLPRLELTFNQMSFRRTNKKCRGKILKLRCLTANARYITIGGKSCLLEFNFHVDGNISYCVLNNIGLSC